MQPKNAFMCGACLLPIVAVSWTLVDLSSGASAYPFFFVAFVSVLLTGAICEAVARKIYGRRLLGLKWGEWACMVLTVWAMLPLMMPTVSTHCRPDRHRVVQPPVEAVREQ